MQSVALARHEIDLLATFNANEFDHGMGIVLPNGVGNGKRGIDMPGASAAC
jgi:hypothetical protein